MADERAFRHTDGQSSSRSHVACVCYRGLAFPPCAYFQQQWWSENIRVLARKNHLPHAAPSLLVRHNTFCSSGAMLTSRFFRSALSLSLLLLLCRRRRYCWPTSRYITTDRHRASRFAVTCVSSEGERFCFARAVGRSIDRSTDRLPALVVMADYVDDLRRDRVPLANWWPKGAR